MEVAPTLAVSVEDFAWHFAPSTVAYVARACQLHDELVRVAEHISAEALFHRAGRVKVVLERAEAALTVEEYYAPEGRAHVALRDARDLTAAIDATLLGAMTDR